jgi:hypothetical protein
MKVSDKLSLIDKIGRALQAKFRFDEIDTFFVTAQVGLRHGLRGWRWQAWDCWARRFLWTTGASSDSRIQ